MQSGYACTCSLCIKHKHEKLKMGVLPRNEMRIKITIILWTGASMVNTELRTMMMNSLLKWLRQMRGVRHPFRD